MLVRESDRKVEDLEIKRLLEINSKFLTIIVQVLILPAVIWYKYYNLILVFSSNRKVSSGEKMPYHKSSVHSNGYSTGKTIIEKFISLIKN